MSLFDPIRHYCERSGPGLFDEPLNAISNLAFFIAAYVLWKRYKQIPDPQAAWLITLLATVGLGSTLFHTFANGLTMLGDVIPIAFLTLTYLWTAMRRFLCLSRLKATAFLIAFAFLAFLAETAPPALRFNGSVSYFPCLLAVFLLAFFARKRSPQAASTIFRASCWFCVSLTYRSIDMTLCPTIAIGTHFIWHITNGWVLYLLISALLPKPATAANAA